MPREPAGFLPHTPMLNFSANLTMLFNELPFLDRFEAAAKANFKAVEFLFPYGFAVEEIAARLKANDLQLVLHNLPAGNWDGGERGIACLPDRVDDFRFGMSTAIRYASALGVPRLNCLAGIAPSGVSPGLLHDTFVANLRYAADMLGSAGIRLLIEPINTFDIPRFFLSRSRQALEILDEVASDNLSLQYDVYHAQRMEGEIAATLQQHLARIGHIQIADNPGRHEPGTGEINYRWLFKHLAAIGYSGWIGCEYKPAAQTLDGLGWMRQIA